MDDPNEPGLADLHIHTSDGDGMASIEEILDSVGGAGELSVIAITEHDDITPALKARERWARGSHGFDLVTGMEVTTRSGHIIALFVDRPIRSFLTPDETIAAIHEAGGMALIPHPLSWLTRSVGERAMNRLLADPETTPDGLEISPSPAARITAARARRLNERWGLPEYGSSDAHFLEAVGSAVTHFPGRSADDLRRALEAGATRAEIRRLVGPAQLGWRKVVRQQWRGLCVTPRKIVGPRVRQLLGRARAGP
ncbi:MAG: PHP-associated domain-containing protein [Dehalococcoidia bacterium]